VTSLTGYLRALAIGVSLGLSVGMCGIIAFASNDTPSLGNGDCWRPSTPTTCTKGHLSIKGTPVFFRAIDQFSSIRPSYLAPAQNAVTDWNNAPGPQFYSWTPRSGDVYTYLNVSTTGNYGLGATNGGITWLCPPRPAGCESDTTRPVVIWYSNVYLNMSLIDGRNYTASDIQHLWSHESGHAMGLSHNTSGYFSVMTDDYSVTSPTNLDIGAYPGCSNGGFGMNCIYGYGD
jgi:hypothetical protein